MYIMACTVFVKLLDITLEHRSLQIETKGNSSNEYEIFENFEFKICK